MKFVTPIGTAIKNSPIVVIEAPLTTKPIPRKKAMGRNKKMTTLVKSNQEFKPYPSAKI